MKKLLRIALLGVVSAAVAFAVWVPVQQRVFRHRAERLLAEVRALDINRGTWADAQAIMQRWGRWGRHGAVCTAERCEYRIDLMDGLGQLLEKHPKVGEAVSNHWGIFGVLGARLALVSADVIVYRGTAMGSFHVQIDVQPKNLPSDVPQGEYSVIVETRMVPRLLRFYRSQMLSHPEYAVHKPSACSVCLAMGIDVTPWASQADVERFFDYRLECLTRRSPCLRPSDVLPAGWKQLLADSEAYPALQRNVKACAYPIWLLGRDAENAAVVQLVSLETRPSEYGKELVWHVALRERLKNAESWRDGEEKEFAFNPVRGSSDLQVRAGDRYLLFFESNPVGGNRQQIRVVDCGLAAANDRSVTGARAGVARDLWTSSPRG